MSEKTLITVKDLSVSFEGSPAVKNISFTLSAGRVLALVVLEGQSYERTAQLCECSIGTVKSRLHRARHKLHEIVECA